MPNWSEDIGAYLKDDTRSYKPIFTIFTHWTPEDYDEVCTRVQNALVEVGISLPSRLPQFKLKNRKVALDTAYRQRTTAEALLFGQYNHDGLFLLPHQKDPEKLPPSWFVDSMLVPGRYSIGQKLLSVSYSRIKVQNKRRKARAERTQQSERPIAPKAHTRDRTMSPAEPEDTPTTQDVTSTRPATVEQDIVAAKQPSPASLNTVSDDEQEPTASKTTSITFVDFIIHIGTIFELEDGSLYMRRTLRNPETWTDSFAPNRFNFEKLCQSVQVTEQWNRELYFFPDLSKDPHSIVGDDELDGVTRCLYKQSVMEGVAGHISLFVATDVSHVRKLTLEQRVLPKQTAQVIMVRKGHQ